MYKWYELFLWPRVSGKRTLTLQNSPEPHIPQGTALRNTTVCWLFIRCNISLVWRGHGALVGAFFFCCCCSRQRPHTLCTSVNVSVHIKKKYGNFVVNLQVFSSYSYVLRRDYLMIKNKLRNEPTQSHKNKITQYRNINQNHNVLSFLLESLFTTVF